MTLIQIALTLFSAFFIGYSIYLLIAIYKESGLPQLYKRVRNGIYILFLIFLAILTLSYYKLSEDGYKFVKSYSFNIEPSTKSITVGNSDSADIKIYNRFSDSEHILFDFTSNPPKLILTSTKRNAIVNDKLLSLKREGYPDRVEVKSGDTIRLGYSDYTLNYRDDRLTLKPIFTTLSILNLLNIYSTTTIPDLTKEQIESSISIWYIYAITVGVALLITTLITKFMGLVSKFAYIGKEKFILYPFLYISFLIAYLFYASLINFTALEFFQYSIYSKGGLYTVLLVYIILAVTASIFYISYRDETIFRPLFVTLTTVAIIFIAVYLVKEHIYTSSGFIFKFIAPTEISFIITVFGFAFGRALKSLSQFFQRDKVDTYKLPLRGLVLFILFIGTLIALAITVSSLFKEGFGVVIIEIFKLLSFFIIISLILNDFLKSGLIKAFAIIASIIAIFTLLSLIFLVKDMGSLIHIIIAIAITILFFLDSLKKAKVINPITVGVTIVLILLAVGSLLFINKNNIRIPMWISPFEQSLDVKNHFFLYYYEQIGRGIFLIRDANILPRDFTLEQFLPLANLHTDFIFPFFVNIFGIIGFVSIVIAFIITILSFQKSITIYQSDRRDIFRFIYGLNVIFFTYVFSYIIVNVFSVLQIIPLTDVPFPILTYGRSVLIFFFILYFAIAIINHYYIELISRVRGR